MHGFALEYWSTGPEQQCVLSMIESVLIFSYEPTGKFFSVTHSNDKNIIALLRFCFYLPLSS